MRVRTLRALLLIVAVGLCTVSHAQNTQQEWQAKAVQQYPELGVAGSAFNKRFVDAYNERRKLEPQFFNDPRWPLLLAQELAGNARSVIVDAPITPSGSARSGQPQTKPSIPAASVYASPHPASSNTAPQPIPSKTSSEVSPTFWTIAGVLGVVFLFIVFTAHESSQKRKRLMAKYGDSKIVDMIMRRMFWTNQTEEQLIDSLGRPADIDQRVLKSKVKETWKYHRTGRNRFGLRITVENGLVVGWDNKG